MAKPLRVLHVLGSLNMGGAETLIMNIYRSINRKNIQFDFIVHGDDIGIYEKEIIALGGKIYRMPKYCGLNHSTYKKAWKNFLKHHPEYLIIHGHMRSTAAIYLKIAKKFKRITICHSHNTSNGKGLKSFIKYVYQYNIRHISDYFMGCSYEANRWLFGKKIAKSNDCLVLKNGIDVSKFAYNEDSRKKIRSLYGIKENDLLIGNIGRLCYQKNHEYLLDIMAEIIKRRPNSKLMIIGDGELELSIKEKITKLNLTEKVIMLKNQNNINELLSAMDVFVFPSHFEGLGIVVVEAQASGLPCYISDTIPKEVCLTNIVKCFSITDEPSFWALQILKEKEFDRKSEIYTKIITDKGYSIKNAVELLSDFYLRIIK